MRISQHVFGAGSEESIPEEVVGCGRVENVKVLFFTIVPLNIWMNHA